MNPISELCRRSTAKGLISFKTHADYVELLGQVYISCQFQLKWGIFDTHLPNDGSCDYGVWDRALPLPLKCRCSPAERWLSERPTESRLPSVGLQCAGSPPTTRRSGRLWRTLRRTGRRTDPRRIIPWTSLGPPYIWGSHEPQQPERTEQFVSHKNNFQH